MKTSVAQILIDHLRTLRGASPRISFSDVFVFYLLPCALAILAYYFRLTITTETHGISITIFGIFIGLLFSVQVAIFGVLQRSWPAHSDLILDEQRKIKSELRRVLLGEINANISYLIVISTFFLIVFFLFCVSDKTDCIEMPITVLILSHFTLTILMVVKRTHAVFQTEYADEVNDGF